MRVLVGLVTRDTTVAANAIAAGRLCAIPTETVYGLAADAGNADAVAAVFAAKGRPADHPLIVHVAESSDVSHWIAHLPDWVPSLTAHYWPGPLTIVGRRTPAASDAVTGGQDTVAVRVPSHAVAHSLLVELRRQGVSGVVAPSANRFGHVSPTTAEHVVADLGPYLTANHGLVLDGGPCAVGLESTIVLATGEQPVILRPGAVTGEMVYMATGLRPGGATHGIPRVPGSLDSHYAPRAAVRMMTADDYKAAAPSGAGLIALHELATRPGWTRLAEPASVDEFARELYAALRRADDLGLATVDVVVPPSGGMVDAVRDRVSRAAATRPSGTMTS